MWEPRRIPRPRTPVSARQPPAFGEDLQRGYKQTAFFVSADFDIIPKVLTITGGTRYYHYDEYETGSEYYTSTSCANVPNGCPAGKNLDAIGLHKTYNGFRSRGNLTWHITPDVLLYYTYSQGYRPGGFNRETGASLVAAGPALDENGKNIKQLFKPSSYAPDTLTNHEIGVKSEFPRSSSAGQSVGLPHAVGGHPGSAVQPERVGAIPPSSPTVRNYRINGAELQVVARVTQGLTVQGSTSYNDAKQTNKSLPDCQ